MTRLGRGLLFFPALSVTLMLLGAAAFVVAPSLGTALALLFACYGFPLCAFHLLAWRYPLREGRWFLDARRFSAWWGSHQIQAVYIALPQLEALLHLVPGLFSMWLRLWGSRIGRSVYWTPRVEIGDRSLLEIGDRVVFGHKVELYSHIVRPRRGRPVLYLRRIVIGAGAFLGAGTRVGPGARVAAGAAVPLLTVLYPNARAPADRTLPRRARVVA